MYKLAIFDLDGTLLNTITDLSNACNAALKAFDYPVHDEALYKTYVGNGIYKLVERAVPQAIRSNQKKVLEVKAVFDAYYLEHNLDYTKPYDGILPLLKTLNEKGVKCGVVSNKAHDYAKELVKKIFGNLIAETYGQREGIPAKPSPEAVWELMKAFQEKPASCIYIGDSNVDMLTAQNAGLTSIGVSWGFRTRKELQEAGADYIVDTPSQIEKIIL